MSMSHKISTKILVLNLCWYLKRQTTKYKPHQITSTCSFIILIPRLVFNLRIRQRLREIIWYAYASVYLLLKKKKHLLSCTKHTHINYWKQTHIAGAVFRTENSRHCKMYSHIQRKQSRHRTKLCWRLSSLRLPSISRWFRTIAFKIKKLFSCIC